MITVSVAINGTVIMARSAVNLNKQDEQGRHLYEVDDGSLIYHRQGDGARALATKMLATVHERVPEAPSPEIA